MTRYLTLCLALSACGFPETIGHDFRKQSAMFSGDRLTKFDGGMITVRCSIPLVVRECGVGARLTGW